MSDNWQPGDLALCVKRGAWQFARSGRVVEGDPVRSGGVYCVRRVGFSRGDDLLTLWFEGIGGDLLRDSYAACRFRKIKPLTDEECEQFTAELNAPVREPVS
jgi:hypothetical protein